MKMTMVQKFDRLGVVGNSNLLSSEVMKNDCLQEKNNTDDDR